MPNSLDEKCRHLMHLPSGKCLGCGEQHQPLPDYQPGDDEKWSAEHGGMTDGTNPVMPDERKAIASLHRLAKRWPDTLWLFSASGSLHVMRKDEDGGKAHLPDGGIDPAFSLGIINIANDGGDW